MFFEIAESLLEVGVEFLFPHPAHHAAAGAVAAIRSAAVCHQKEHAVRVAMHQARNRHRGVLPTRVRHVIGRIPTLLHARNDLPTDRAAGIFGLDEVEIVGRHGEREFGAGQKNPGALLGGEL